jgi:hypothetical protein
MKYGRNRHVNCARSSWTESLGVPRPRAKGYFGNSAEFWLGLQNDYDLEESRIALRKELDSIKTLSDPKAAIS